MEMYKKLPCNDLVRKCCFTYIELTTSNNVNIYVDFATLNHYPTWPWICCSLNTNHIYVKPSFKPWKEYSGMVSFSLKQTPFSHVD